MPDCSYNPISAMHCTHQVLGAMLIMQIPGTSVHWYGKEVQNKRKLGHITITGTDNQQAQERLHSIDPAAADAMAAASDRYTEATSSAQQTQGQSSCAVLTGWLVGQCPVCPYFCHLSFLNVCSSTYVPVCTLSLVCLSTTGCLTPSAADCVCVSFYLFFVRLPTCLLFVLLCST